MPVRPASVPRVALLAALSGPEADRLLAESAAISVERGRHVTSRGQDAAAIIVRGAAVVRSPVAIGTEAISELLGPGDSSGLATTCANRGATGDVVAIRRTDAVVVPGDAIRRLVATSHGAARACLTAVAREHGVAERRAAILNVPSLATRVELRMLELAERFGTRDRGEVQIMFPLTQDELASWSGTSRDTAAKTLSELRAAGVVATARRHLVVRDLDALRRRTAPRTDATVHELLRQLR